MTATRSTHEEYLYRKQRQNEANGTCPFCSIHKGHTQYVEETRYFKIIRNRTPYSIWDGQGVMDHLMIIPKKHTDKLGDLSSKARVEYVDLIDKYESKAYNLYARAPASKVKSVSHHHTHLIQLDNKERSFIFLVRKPFYIRLSF
jgi:diadenosine tetraphosphate (Ap4A) HIT family hydrolase